jgi:hypothetical protein
MKLVKIIAIIIALNTYLRQMTSSFGDIIFNPGKNCIKDLLLRSDIEFITRYDVNKLVHR